MEKKEELILIKSLQSTSKKDVLASIEKIRANGSKNILIESFKVFKNGSDEEIKGAIFALWTDLKEQGIAELFAQAIQDSEFKSIKKELIEAVWQSKLEFSNIGIFVDAIITEEFETAIEALSAIENNLDHCSGEHIKEEMNKLKMALPSISEEKKAFVKTIIDDYS